MGRHRTKDKKGESSESCLLSLPKSVLHLPIGKRASRLPERWSDGLFFEVVEKSSEFYVGAVLGVVRARRLRRRPLDERANVELLDKLMGMPWQQAPRDPDATAVPTVISALPDRADPIHGEAMRTYLRKNIELRRHGYTGGCPGCDVARLNTADKPHSAACRARVEEAMTGDEIGRARLAEDLVEKRQEART